MKSNTDRTILRNQRLKHAQGEGLNWLHVAAGAILSMISIRIGCKLNQMLDAKKPDNASDDLKGKKSSASKRRSGACPLHSRAYCFTQDEDRCYHRLSEISEGMAEIKHASRSSRSSMSKEPDVPLPLVTIPSSNSNKENDIMWVPSPEHLELPREPFINSNSSESLCVSEFGSDMITKKEVIQKLRQQLKRRDEMILEMQTQISDLHNSLNAQISRSTHLQSQLESANQNLFESETKVQRFGKSFADQCAITFHEKSTMWRNGHAEAKTHTQLESANHNLFESETEVQRFGKSFADKCAIAFHEKSTIWRKGHAEAKNGDGNGYHERANTW